MYFLVCRESRDEVANPAESTRRSKTDRGLCPDCRSNDAARDL